MKLIPILLLYQLQYNFIQLRHFINLLKVRIGASAEAGCGGREEVLQKKVTGFVSTAFLAFMYRTERIQ